MAGGPAASGAGIGANAPKNKLSGILMVSFAAFAGILFGYDTGTISCVTAMKDFLRLFGEPTTDLTNHPTGYMITSSQQSLVTSILSAGTFFGECRVPLQIPIHRHAMWTCVIARVFTAAYVFPSFPRFRGVAYRERERARHTAAHGHLPRPHRA